MAIKNCSQNCLVSSVLPLYDCTHGIRLIWALYMRLYPNFLGFFYLSISLSNNRKPDEAHRSVNEHSDLTRYKPVKEV